MWARFEDEFDDECADLPDAAYRLHVAAILWIYRTEQAGLRVPRHVALRLGGKNYVRSAGRLVAEAFWKPNGDGWEVVHHADVIRESFRRVTNTRIKNKAIARARRRRDGGTAR
jgi:hypothetical protein